LVPSREVHQHVPGIIDDMMKKEFELIK